MTEALPALCLIAVPGRRRRTIELCQEAERRGFGGIYVPSPFGNMSMCEAMAWQTSSVVFGTALTNGVTALVLLLATAAVIDRLHAMMVREAGRARFDPLTGLPNRRACEERCAVEIARLQRRSGSPSARTTRRDRAASACSACSSPRRCTTSSRSC